MSYSTVPPLGLALGRNHTHYAQSNCAHRMKVIEWIYLLPIAGIIGLAETGVEAGLVVATPPGLVVISWAVAIFLRRRTLWYKNGVFQWPSFFAVW
jgi:hypothetical protein